MHLFEKLDGGLGPDLETPGAVKAEGQLDMSCWCVERSCQLCAYKFQYEGQAREESSSSDEAVWRSDSDESWFLVQGPGACAKGSDSEGEVKTHGI